MSIFWKTVAHNSKTFYQVNRFTGARRAIQRQGGHQPIDQHWIDTGNWIASPASFSPDALREGLQHGEVFHVTGKLSDHDRDRLKRSWQAHYRAIAQG